MTLKELAKELERAASLNGVDILIDSTAEKHSFIPIINEKGIVGAIGQYLENNKDTIGYFILNSKVVKYALDEGFNREELFDCFKDKIFTETDKDQFFKIMTEKTID
jgi:hypothetical protein